MTAHTLSTASRCIPARRRRAGALSELIGLWRQRRSLSRLDAHLLSDIGLTAEEAAREASRPLWDAPRTWLR